MTAVRVGPRRRRGVARLRRPVLGGQGRRLRETTARRRSGRRLCWLTLLALVTVPPGEARAGSDTAGPPEPFVESIEVTLVTVDVWVSDRQGRPVTGLDRSSFEVLHDGRPVPIEHFVEVRAGKTVADGADGDAGGGAAASGLAQPSHLVVYLDASRLHPSHLDPLIAGLERLLDVGALDPGRVLVVRQDRYLSVKAPFGSTEQELRAALARVTKGNPGGIVHENETRLALDAIRAAWEETESLAAAATAGLGLAPDGAGAAGDAGPGGAGGGGGAPGGDPRSRVGGVGTGGGPGACGLFVSYIRPTLDAWARSRSARIAVTLSNLSDLVSFLAGLPGVKTLIYLSDGLDTKPGIALANYASGLCPGAGSELLRSSELENNIDRFLALTRHANANRVTIHALQAGGLRSSRVASAVSQAGAGADRGRMSLGSFESTERSSAQEGLTLIADETGGRAIFDRNELGPSLLEIGEASRSYYALTYEAPPASADKARKSHRIDVKLAADSLVARYRRGYLEKDPERWVTERLEGALNLGITANPLEVRLGAGAAEAGADGKRQVRLHVMVPVDRLAFLQQSGGSVAEVAVRVLAREVEENTLAIGDQQYRVKGSSGSNGVATLPLELELAEGRHVMAVSVQDRGSGEASFVTTQLDTRGDG